VFFGTPAMKNVKLCGGGAQRQRCASVSVLAAAQAAEAHTPRRGGLPHLAHARRAARALAGAVAALGSLARALGALAAALAAA
jgi:hypothetical protein